MLSQHANEMQERRIDIHQMHTRFQAEVQQYELKLRCHIRNVKKHLGLSEDIRLLVRTHASYVHYPNRISPG